MDMESFEGIKAAFLEPSSTLTTVVAYRSTLLPVVANIVDEMIERGPRRCDHSFSIPVSMALLKALNLIPRIFEREVLLYFSVFPAPSHHLRDVDSMNDGDDIVSDVLACAESMLLGLYVSRELCNLWEWYDVLPLLEVPQGRIQWYGMKCMGLVLGTSIKPLEMDQELSRENELRWKEVMAKYHLHRTAMYSEAGLKLDVETIPRIRNPERSSPQEKQIRFIHDDKLSDESMPLSKRYILEQGFLVPKREDKDGAVSKGCKEFHPTIDQKDALQRFIVALSVNKGPILLEGPPSSGKTEIINYIAAKTGNINSMIRVHLDDQTDSKTLLGGYVCTAKPGEFVWAPGPVVRALQEGQWLVLENINLGSSEVITMISSLAKTGSIEIPSRGDSVRANPGFQLIATCTTFAGKVHDNFIDKMLFSSSTHIELEAISIDDQRMILEKIYPSIQPLLSRVLLISDIWTMVSTGQDLSHSKAIEAGVIPETTLVTLKAIAGKIERIFTFRDIMKWAQRMVLFHGHALLGMPDLFEGLCEDFLKIPVVAREGAFVELADCTCLSVSSPLVRREVVNIIADLLLLPVSVVEDYIRLQKPSISFSTGMLHIGRARLPRSIEQEKDVFLSPSFAQTGEAMRLMERLSVSIINNEPILLVGETGVGKTTVIQEIAKLSGNKFAVVNLSQQTDSSDLIGGFRPRVPGDAVVELVPDFISLVKESWRKGDNEKFLSRVVSLARKKKWAQLLKAYKVAISKWFRTREMEPREEQKLGVKRQRQVSENPIANKWHSFREQVSNVEAATSLMDRGFAFSFAEGILVKAFQRGWWLLLDEINLAPTEVLERIAGILDSKKGWILTERGDEEEIQRHPEFRIFAAMNPATDSGKKSLPPLVRDRFTEFWVNEPSDTGDLMTIISQHLGPLAFQVPIENIVNLYTIVKQKSMSTLQDGGGTRPIYNLRTLTRALEYARNMADIYGTRRALVDGFSMSFQTQLDNPSSQELDKLIALHLLPKGMSLQSVLRISPECPSSQHVKFDEFWVEGGDEALRNDGSFIITPTVMGHLKNLARAVLLKKYPILLQGPTSSGKTSLISYLAQATGHKCIRINNHEHTDIQDYIGSYMSDSDGRLVFNEGPLIQALRYGYWVILDELNLAPSDVLEALNRLLDDNRELFVPELQEVVLPNKNFMLFATQNPPGIYAGRKILSRAFRSRFLEIQVDDIPDDELHDIVEKRCSIAPSYSKKMVTVMRELQRRRSVSNVFAGKHGYITPRDLFRWANRPATSYHDLAVNGYFVLAERLRDDSDRQVVLSTLENILRTKIPRLNLYEKFDKLDPPSKFCHDRKIVWTESFKRIFCLLHHCLANNEPALLVGETGIGKTTACQLLASYRHQNIHILNCNQHTETSDFIGGYRPNRRRGAICKRLREQASAYSTKLASTRGDSDFVDKLFDYASMATDILPESIRQSWLGEIAAFRAPFEWIDGPLIHAMKNGDIILIDEINLAEDAVLERLNSVLESSKVITLAEKSAESVETVVAHDNFQIIATMNPGGDFGKKELSPALMNRFTSFWVPALSDENELLSILECRLIEPLHRLLVVMVEFWLFFESNIASAARQNLSVREMLCFADFMNLMYTNGLDDVSCIMHASEMVVIDGLGLGSGADEEVVATLQNRLRDRLKFFLNDKGILMPEVASVNHLERHKDRWGIPPFFVESREGWSTDHYNFATQTAHHNLFRLLRSMQLNRPILLEGSPGVGKTTLVEAMCHAVGQRFVRINLSDQTDMMDLLGANYPSPDGSLGDFVWTDGPLLEAMKSGSWVLLDELNLANQSILEGLNALLDHRGEIYVPELDAVIPCKTGFRLFGAQNPIQEGGGRKGLPRSFLNRFVRVRIRGFCDVDLINISESIYPNIPRGVIVNMTSCLLECASKDQYDGQRGLDFNLRDLLRWCKLVGKKAGESTDIAQPLRWARFYGSMLLSNRMRSLSDKMWVEGILNRYLPQKTPFYVECWLELEQERILLGEVQCDRKPWEKMLKHPPMDAPQQNSLLRIFFSMQQSLLECIKNGWLGIVVGETGNGKSSCISNLASLLGKKIIQIQIHEGTDISDLLGGYEQIDVVREGTSLVSRIKKILWQLAVSSLHEGKSLSNLETMSRRLFDNSHKVDLERSKYIVKVILDNILPLAELAQQCQRLPLSAELSQIQQDGEEFLKKSELAGKFEWVDGTLTKCILDGSWVILRDANLCNPSVLDRLNPLFEPEGFISLNECGSSDEGPRVIIPNAEFRLFITYDPSNGEISRAMRNRGIEINWNWNQHVEDGLADKSLYPIILSDLVGLVCNASIPRELSRQLVEIWMEENIPKSRNSLQYLSNWSSMVHDLVCHGLAINDALSLSFKQIFKVLPPVDFSLAKNMGFDSSIFFYPKIIDICQSSGLEMVLSDWSFITETCKPFCQFTDQGEFMLMLETHGAFGALNSVSLSLDSSEILDEREDVINASVAIYMDSPSQINRARFLLQILQRFERQNSAGFILGQEEMYAWKALFSEMMDGKSIRKLTPEDVRFSLERHRLRALAQSLPENLDQCRNLLEASAWQYESPFSRESDDTNDAALLKWIWVTLTSLYGLPFKSLSRDACDAISFLRRTLIAQNLNHNKEILAHTWHRLVKAFGTVCRKDLNPGIFDNVERLVQKVDRILNGTGEQNFIYNRFLEMTGKPIVALNFELHQILSRAEEIVNQASVDYDGLILYRQGGSEKIRNSILMATPSIRSELLQTLQIFMAGSLLDAQSLPHLRKMLGQLSDFIDQARSKSEISEEKRLDIDLLDFGNAFEELDSLDDIILRRMEADLALRTATQQKQNNFIDYTKATSEIQNVLTKILIVPSRMISQALPFQAFFDYSRALLEKIDISIESKAKSQKGLTLMMLLQMHRDLWSPFLSPSGRYLRPGPSTLHTCTILASMSKIANREEMPSLKHREPRLHQIVHSINSIAMFRDSTENIGNFEWRSSVVLLLTLLHCILGEKVVELNIISEDMDDRELFTCLKQKIGQTLDRIDSVPGIDNGIIHILKQSMQLLVLDENIISRDGMFQRGKAMSLLSLAQLNFSKPRAQFDPSLAGEMERQALGFIVEHFYQNEMQLRHLYSNLPLSRPQSQKIDNIKSHIEFLEEKRDQISEITSARPEVSQYSSLLGEISAFVLHLGDPTRIMRMIHGIEDLKSDSISHEAGIWIDSCNNFIASINSKYPCYRDIFGPFELSLRGIQYGLALMLTSKKIGKGGNRCIDIIQSLISSPLNGKSISFTAKSYNILEELLQTDGDEQSAVSAKIKLCEIAMENLDLGLRYASTPEQRFALYSEFQNIGKQAHDIWVAVRENESSRQAEEESLFEIKARQLELTKEEFLAKNSIEDLYRNHSKSAASQHDYSLSYDIMGEENPSEKRSVIEGLHKSTAINEKFHLDAVLSRLVSVFYSFDNSSHELDISRNNNQFSLAVDIVNNFDGLLPIMLDVQSIPGFLLSLCEEHRELSKVGHTDSDTNLYSSNIQEASRLQYPLKRILSRIYELLEEWPDHPILEQLARIGNKILEISLSSPLKTFSTGVELMLNKAQIWEETAAKHVTLKEHLQPLISIATSWRELELKSWKGLLDRVRKDIRNGAWESWFHIFGIINTKVDSMTDFINTVDSFVQNSSVGQFEERLKILRSFASFLVNAPREKSTKDQDSILSNILYNLERYYSQFQQQVDEYINREMVPLEKDLSDFVSLAKWEDKGFYAMRASSEKAHNHLHKIVSKAKEVLWTPCKACLAVAAQNIGMSKQEDCEGSGTRILSNLLELESDPVLINIRRGKLANIKLGKYSERLNEISKKVEKLLHLKLKALGQVKTTVNNIDTLACSALLQCIHLNGDDSKGSKSRKKKALSDFFKALEACGTSKLQSSIPFSARSSHYWIMEPIPQPENCFESFVKKVDKNEFWIIGNLYYYKSIARMARLEQMSNRPHEDIQHREIQLSNNFGKYLIFMQQKCRNIISEVSSFLDNLGKSIHAMESSMNCQATRNNDSYKALEEAMSCCMLVNSKYLHYFEALLENGNLSLPLDNISILLKLLRKSQSVLATLIDQLVKERSKTMLFDSTKLHVTVGMERIFEQCRLHMDSLSKSIVSKSSGVVGAEYLRDAYNELSVCLKAEVISPQVLDEKDQTGFAADFSLAYEDLVRACMVWAQNVPLDDVVSECSSNISRMLPLIEKLLNLSSIQAIAKKSNSIAYMLVQMSKYDHPFQHDISDMVARVIPLLIATRSSLENFLLHVSLLHRALSKLSYITLGIFCELVEKGFCVQEENQSNDLAGEETKDGIGLGDGDTKGAIDISDQLHNEDQILGAEKVEQDEPYDENDGDRGEDEKAQGIEMDEDFDGDMEDVEELQDDEDSKEDQSDGQNEQLDQQMGDANGADVVDEKAWDEDEGLEDQKVEDEAKATADKSLMEYAQGKEEDAQDPQNNEAEAKDNDQAVPEENDNDSHHEDGEEYDENIDTTLLDQDRSCDEIEFPEDMNLDDMDALDKNEAEMENEDDAISDGSSDDEGQEDDNLKEGYNEVTTETDESSNDGDTHKEDVSKEENSHEKVDNDMPDVPTEAGNGGESQAKGANQKDTVKNREEDLAETENDRDMATDMDGVDGGDLSGKGAAVDRMTKTDKPEEEPTLDTNPFRSVQDAIEEWQNKNAIDLDKIEEDGGIDTGNDGDPSSHQEQLRFVQEHEIKKDNDDNMIANANEDQANHGFQQEQDKYQDSAEEKQEDNSSNLKKDEVFQDIDDKSTRTLPAQENLIDNSDQNLESSKKQDDSKYDSKEGYIDTSRSETDMMQHLDRLSLDIVLNERREESLRASLDEAIHMDDSHSQKENTEYGRQVWNNCELLTAHLSGELAEQIRLILEPTTSSKLGGEYRSGKRINMKRVIGYIASHFKKDKIWMRRTQPDKRRYQVLIAVDDSKSMAETACGAFALESLTLICNAMSRIEIGDLGVIRFGGSIGADLIHPMGQSFSPLDGAKVMSKMRFDADNTIDDKPMGDVLKSIDLLLEQQSKRLSHSASLQQLVIILADGRFHEKDDLKKVVMDVTCRPGVMYAFVILDSPQNSILDMQSVSFGSDGKPVFNKYIDSFPFPLYTVLQDIQYLPKTLSHLLRQWIEFTSLQG